MKPTQNLDLDTVRWHEKEFFNIHLFWSSFGEADLKSLLVVARSMMDSPRPSRSPGDFSWRGDFFNQGNPQQRGRQVNNCSQTQGLMGCLTWRILAAGFSSLVRSHMGLCSRLWSSGLQAKGGKQKGGSSFFQKPMTSRFAGNHLAAKGGKHRSQKEVEADWRGDWASARDAQCSGRTHQDCAKSSKFD